MVSIGIAPWGIVDRRNELLGKKKEVAFHPVPQPRSVSILSLNFVLNSRYVNSRDGALSELCKSCFNWRER